MKIKPDHYQHMLTAIKTVAPDYPRPTGFNNVRYRWALSHRAGLTPWICDNLYSYADDTHIDTALRAIMKELAI